MGRVAGRLARVEPRRRVRDLVLGLLSELPRKNYWSIAEWAGDSSPDGMQQDNAMVWSPVVNTFTRTVEVTSRLTVG